METKPRHTEPTNWEHCCSCCPKLESGEVEEYAKSFEQERESLDDDNWDKSYPFNVENVEQFAKFCLESGGFEIC